MVRLFEYQGKRLLKRIGIPIPEGEPVSTPQEATEIGQKIGKPVLIKAQVLAIGRSRFGGIKPADTIQEIQSVAEDMLGKEIKGLKIEKVLVEEKLEVDKEFYLSITISDSYAIKAPIILFSTEGGVDIEQLAEKQLSNMSRMNIDYLKGLELADARKLVSKLDVPEHLIDELSKIACKLYEVFVKWDVNTAEINPLILTRDGRLVAADCRITLDDNSVFRHQDEFKIDLPRDMVRPPTELEKIAWKIEESDYRGTCYFVQLNPDIEEIGKGGYVAFHGIGGGASMLAADALIAAGVNLATYVDTSGNPTASKVYRAMKVLLAIPGIEGYCLAGAVLANQEQWYHAYAIVKALREEAKEKPGFPVLILIAGNKEKETHRILKNGLNGLPLLLELYGRAHIYDLDFLAQRMMVLQKEYQNDQARQIREMGVNVEPIMEGPLEKHLAFETQTGRVEIDLSKCIAPECGFACVKADRCYGRLCLKIEDGRPALAGTPEDLKKLCNECLACEVECELQGGNAIRIQLPLYGIEQFKKKHGMPIER